MAWRINGENRVGLFPDEQAGGESSVTESSRIVDSVQRADEQVDVSGDGEFAGDDVTGQRRGNIRRRVLECAVAVTEQHRDRSSPADNHRDVSFPVLIEI